MSEWEEWKQQFIDSKKCIVARREGPHKVACGKPETAKTVDGLPVCGRHKNSHGESSWTGFIKGAKLFL